MALIRASTLLEGDTKSLYAVIALGTDRLWPEGVGLLRHQTSRGIAVLLSGGRNMIGKEKDENTFRQLEVYLESESNNSVSSLFTKDDDLERGFCAT